MLYPLLVYFGIGRFGPSAIAILLIAMCLLRLLVLCVRGDWSYYNGKKGNHAAGRKSAP